MTAFMRLIPVTAAPAWPQPAHGLSAGPVAGCLMHDRSASAQSCVSSDSCPPLRCRANVSGCALNFSPCTFSGQVQTTMPTVQDIGFNMVQPTAFELAYLGAPNNSVATINMVSRCGLHLLQSAVCCTLRELCQGQGLCMCAARSPPPTGLC